MHNIAICRQCIFSFKKALITQFKRINYQCNINFRSFKVSKYFSLKDVSPLTLRANVVYCFKGSCDKIQSYIGMTRRHLALWVQEHLSGKSAIHEHISSCKDCHSYSINNVYTISQADTDFGAIMLLSYDINT